MKLFTLVLIFPLLVAQNAHSQSCTPLGDQVTFGTANVWKGYIYDNVNFTSYKGYVAEGTSGNANFDEGFGGDNVSYSTNGCPVTTETFSARYKLTKTFTTGFNYQFTVGGDDGYRLSLDGGTTWVINNWTDHGYTTTTYSSSTLNGSYNLVLEYYENSGSNRVSFNMTTLCTGSENQTVYGANNVWNGYIYYGTNFNTYNGKITEGATANPNFNETFGGDNVLFPTSTCGIQTEVFSARFMLQKTLLLSNYTFIVGGDDGYRLSLDGGATWVINNWALHTYTVSSYTASLVGNFNIVLEYYENTGQNRVSASINTGILAVNPIVFNGKETDRKVNLQWSLPNEANSNYYEIERGTAGTPFQPIYTAQANGQLNVHSQDNFYHYTDAAPLNTINYYRLHIVGKDKKDTYSDVVSFDMSSNTMVTIFPTLYTNGNLHLKTPVNLTGASIILYDMNGQINQKQTLPSLITKGQTVVFNFNKKMQKGTYILVCKTAEKTILKQLMVIE